jgi:hypothetical protein
MGIALICAGISWITTTSVYHMLDCIISQLLLSIPEEGMLLF